MMTHRVSKTRQDLYLYRVVLLQKYAVKHKMRQIFFLKIFVSLSEIKNEMNLRLPYKIVRFYIDGFRSMTVGKTLWLIIGIKLFIMFAILKLFFFPNFLKTNFDNDAERSEYIIEQLTK